MNVTPEQAASIMRGMQAMNRALESLAAQYAAQTAVLARIAEAIEDAQDEKVLALAAQIAKQAADPSIAFPHVMVEPDPETEISFAEWHAKRLPVYGNHDEVAPRPSEERAS